MDLVLATKSGSYETLMRQVVRVNYAVVFEILKMEPPKNRVYYGPFGSVCRYFQFYFGWRYILSSTWGVLRPIGVCTRYLCFFYFGHPLNANSFL